MIKIECLNCHNLISIDDEVYLTKWKCCPCCMNNLWEEMPIERIDTFGKILFMAVKRGKDQGCKNPKLIKGILQDETPKELDKELKIFLRMFTNQHLDALIEAFDLDTDAALRVLNKIKNSMIYEEAFAENWVDQMMENCMEAIRLYHGESHYVKKNYIILDQQNNDAKMETATDAAGTKESSSMVNDDITDVNTDDETDDEILNEHIYLNADKNIKRGIKLNAVAISVSAISAVAVVAVFFLFFFDNVNSFFDNALNEASIGSQADSNATQFEGDDYNTDDFVENAESDETDNTTKDRQEPETSEAEDESLDYLEAVITGSNTVRIRTSASVINGNNIITTLANGTRVTVIGETTGADGKLWYLIKFYLDSKELSGYIRYDYLTLTDPEKYAEYRTLETYTIIATANFNLKLRKTPSVMGESVTTVLKGNTMLIQPEAVEDDYGKLWYKAKVTDGENELEGYVRSDLLNIELNIE